MIAPIGFQSMPVQPVYFGKKKKIVQSTSAEDTVTTPSAPAIGLTHFARDRYTPASNKSHFDGSWDELKDLVRAQWPSRKQAANNSQVFLIPVPPNQLHRFYSKTIAVDDNTPLTAKFAPRRDGEESYIQVEVADLKKSPAQSAEIVVYSHDLLKQDEENFSNDTASYYIVAVNAYPTEEPEPMNPMTMARNFLGLPGGSKPDTPYTAEDFARAIAYWSKHV